MASDEQPAAPAAAPKRTPPPKRPAPKPASGLAAAAPIKQSDDPGPVERSLEYGRAARIAGADATSDVAVDVHPGVSADVTFSPEVAAAPASEAETLAADIARIRQIRKPFGGMTQKLYLPQRVGYHRHWFNDVGSRVDEAVASGWSHIKGRDGSPIRRTVGTGRDNGAMMAFAMEIPEVFWLEDMAARHAEAAKRMDAIKKSPFQAKAGQAKPSDKGKFYDPTESEEGPIKETTSLSKH